MKNFNNIFNSLNSELKKLESEVTELASKDFQSINKELEENLSILKFENEELRRKIDNLKDENDKLHSQIIQAAYLEKVSLIDQKIQTIQDYFNSKKDTSNLTIIENDFIFNLKKIKSKLNSKVITLKEQFQEKINHLEAEIENTIASEKNNFSNEASNELNKTIEKYEKLKSEEPTHDEILKFFNKANFERFIGLNILNKLGILLIIISLITLSKYTIAILSNFSKGILTFSTGILFVLGGEFFAKKNYTSFSIGLLSGGISIIYAGILLSFFKLDILSANVSLVLYLLVSIFAYLLSLKHNSQVILGFSLIGGYLPLLLIKNSFIKVNYLYLFFAGLTFFTFLLSLKKKWTITVFLGFILNCFSISLLQFLLPNTTNNNIFSLIFIVYSLIIYSFIPINSTLLLKKPFNSSDYSLILLNSFFNISFIGQTIINAGWQDYKNLILLIFATYFAFLAFYLEKRNCKDKILNTTFYLASLVSISLIIPFSINQNWFSLGWLIEGLILSLYGIKYSKKIFEYFGLFLIGLSCFFFFLFNCDYSNLSFDKVILFSQYTAFTLSFIILVRAYHLKKIKNDFISSLNIFTLINFVAYSYYFIYLFYSFYPKFKSISLIGWCIFLYFLSKYSEKISIFEKNLIKLFKFYLNVFNFCFLNFVILSNKMASEVDSKLIIFIKLIICFYFIINLLFKILDSCNEINRSHYALILNYYFLIVSIISLYLYFNANIFSTLMTIFILFYAFFGIILGFYKNIFLLRKNSLIIIFIAIFKLFILDFTNLNQINRIISYFLLGVTLLAISFIYQYFDKKYSKLKKEIEKNEK